MISPAQHARVAERALEHQARGGAEAVLVLPEYRLARPEQQLVGESFLEPVARLHVRIGRRPQPDAGTEVQAAARAAHRLEPEAEQPATLLVLLGERDAVELARAAFDERLVGVTPEYRQQALARDGHLHLSVQRELLAEAVALVPLDPGAQATVCPAPLDDLVLWQHAEQAVEVPRGHTDAALDAGADAL